MLFHIAAFLSVVGACALYENHQIPSANGCTEYQAHCLEMQNLEVKSIKETHHGTVILTIDGHQFILTGTLKHHPMCNCFDDESMYGG